MQEDNPVSDIEQTQRFIFVIEETTAKIAEHLNAFIDRETSAEQCTDSIIALIEKESKGKISDKNRQLIESHVEAVQSSFIKKTHIENAKETFFHCVSLMGVGVKCVGGALVAVGAAKWMVESVVEVTNWCKENIFEHLCRTDLGKTEAVAITSRIICDTAGIMGTVNVVLGISLSLGAVLFTAGKLLEKYEPQRDQKVAAMSSEERELYKQGLIKSIAEVVPKEHMQHYKEKMEYKHKVEDKLNSMEPEQIEIIRAAVRKHVERWRVRKKHDKGKSQNDTSEESQAEDIKGKWTAQEIEMQKERNNGANTKEMG